MHSLALLRLAAFASISFVQRSLLELIVFKEIPMEKEATQATRKKQLKNKIRTDENEHY